MTSLSNQMLLLQVVRYSPRGLAVAGLFKAVHLWHAHTSLV